MYSLFFSCLLQFRLNQTKPNGSETKTRIVAIAATTFPRRSLHHSQQTHQRFRIRQCRQTLRSESVSLHLTTLMLFFFSIFFISFIYWFSKLSFAVLAIAPSDDDALRCKVVALIKDDRIEDALSAIRSSQRSLHDFDFLKVCDFELRSTLFVFLVLKLWRFWDAWVEFNLILSSYCKLSRYLWFDFLLNWTAYVLLEQEKVLAMYHSMWYLNYSIKNAVAPKDLLL